MMKYKHFFKKWLRENIYSAFDFDGLEKGEKYCYTHTTSNRLPNGKVLEFNHYQSDKHCLLPQNLSNISNLLIGFKTIYEHARFIEDNKVTNFNQALFYLNELWRFGLLMGQKDFLNELEKRKSEDAIPTIDTLGWITRNRTESIKKSIESFIQSHNGRNDKRNYMVFDDSTPRNYYKNKLNIEFLNRKYKTNISLIGKTERKFFLKKLNQKLENKVPKHVVEYGLMGLRSIKYQTGANRNTFLLHTLGKFALLNDDDVFCQISKNGNDKNLTFTSNPSISGMSREFFSNQSEFNDKVKFDYNDPIPIHETLLGHSIKNLIVKFNGKVDLNTITPKFAVDNLTRDKRVRVTMMGVAGDSGAGSPISKIFTTNNNLIRLISDSDNFLSKMYSRTVLQSYKTFTVGPPNSLLGMNLGIDNTELLPPFHPNFRNSDGIFAAVLRKCCINCYIGHLPFAISHIPPEVRQVDSSDLTSTTIRIPDALMFSIEEFSNRALTIEGGLKSLGIYLREISEKSNHSLRQYFELINTKFKTNMLCRLEYLLKQHKQINKKWAELTELRVETLNKYIKDGDLSIHFKELTHLAQDNQLLLIRKVYRNFGDLLYYWPEIYNCVSAHKKSILKST